MSESEQFEEIGRIVIEHKKAVQKFSAIESQLKREVDRLDTASRRLLTLLRNANWAAIRDDELDEAIVNMPKADLLLSLLKDARTEADKVRSLEKHKNDFGV